LRLALQGLWQPEHLFELQQAHDLFETYQRLVDECDRQIEAEMAKEPSRAGNKPVPRKPRRCGRKKNDLRFTATGPLFRALGVDLTEIEGIDVGTALVILAEVGVDASRFPTERYFASWLGLCPYTSRSNLREKGRSPRQRATLSSEICEPAPPPLTRRVLRFLDRGASLGDNSVCFGWAEEAAATGGSETAARIRLSPPQDSYDVTPAQPLRLGRLRQLRPRQ
jgi:hypothetical protein